jgi:hypothetical protein
MSDAEAAIAWARTLSSDGLPDDIPEKTAWPVRWCAEQRFWEPVDAFPACSDCRFTVGEDPTVVWPGTDAWKDFGGNPDLVDERACR